MICFICNKSKDGCWLRWDFKRRWFCYECIDSKRYSKGKPNEKDLCWRHKLPMNQVGGCVQCKKENY